MTLNCRQFLRSALPLVAFGAEHGSNIALLDISKKQQIGLEQRLKQANIKTRKIVDGKLRLQFNETLLRRDTDFLLAALTGKEQ